MSNEPRSKLTESECLMLKQLERMRNDACDHAAEFIRRHYCSVHRGVAPSSAPIIFGNDGFSDDLRSQIQVCRLYDELEEEGIRVIGFGLDPDCVTWTLEVASDDCELLLELVWSCWTAACEDVFGVELRGRQPECETATS